MFLILHAAIALAAASSTSNPFIALALGLGTHLLADAIPHGDEPIGPWALRDGHDGTYRFAAIMLIDLALIAGAYAWLVGRTTFAWAPVLAIVGACAPDFMWGLERLLKRRLFGPVTGWYDAAHKLCPIKLPLWLGLSLQFIAAAATWCWLGYH